MYIISNSNPRRLLSYLTISVYKRYHAVELIARYIGITNKVVFDKGVHSDDSKLHFFLSCPFPSSIRFKFDMVRVYLMKLPIIS